MKTLTLLGSLFLPGTYLASFFDMGFFNFETGRSTSTLPQHIPHSFPVSPLLSSLPVSHPLPSKSKKTRPPPTQTMR